MSEIDNLISLLNDKFYISSSNTYLMMSILLTLGISYLVINKTGSAYAGIAGAFIPITICTVLGFVPVLPYALISISLSLILAGKITGGI